MTEKKTLKWDPVKMAAPTEFMDYGQLITRLKKDLGIVNDNWWVFDLQVPHNEEEYQENLRIIRMVQGMAKDAVNSRRD